MFMARHTRADTSASSLQLTYRGPVHWQCGIARHHTHPSSNRMPLQKHACEAKLMANMLAVAPARERFRYDHTTKAYKVCEVIAQAQLQKPPGILPGHSRTYLLRHEHVGGARVVSTLIWAAGRWFRRRRCNRDIRAVGL